MKNGQQPTSGAIPIYDREIQRQRCEILQRNK
jgi:hypothetical protein